MVESGNYIDIRFQERTRYKKPIGVYWAQTASAKLFNNQDEIWVYRIPSLIGALFSVLLLFFFGAILFDRRKAFLGALLLGSSLLLISEAHMAKADALLLLSIIAAQGALGVIYLNKSRNKIYPIIFWIALGAGILIKGPITPFISLITIITLSTHAKQTKGSAEWIKGLFPIVGIPLMLLICLPWFIAINKISGGAFLQESVGKDFLLKILSGQESHGAPPGLYSLLVLVTFFPGSIFLFGLLKKIWGDKKLKPVLFCLAWVLPAWVVLEIVPTKLPHYVLPLYPALSLLCAHGIVESKKIRALFALPGVIFGIVAAIGIVILPIYFGEGISVTTILVSLTVTSFMIFSLHKIRDQESRGALYVAVAGLFLLSSYTFQILIPSITPLWVSKEIKTTLENQTGVVASAGYYEPSLVFLLGKDTKMLGGKGAGRHLVQNSDGIAVVTQEHREGFDSVISKWNHKVDLIASFKGFNYSKGKWLDVEVYKNRK